MDIVCGTGVGCLVFKTGIGQVCHRKLFDILKNFIKLNTFLTCLLVPWQQTVNSPTSSPSHHDLSDLSDLRVTPDVAWDSLWHVFTGRP